MKNQKVTVVDAALGSLDVVPAVNPSYPNTIEIGNKRCDFDKILAGKADLKKDNFHIIIYADAKYVRAEVIINDKTQFNCIAFHASDRHEEIIFSTQK